MEEERTKLMIVRCEERKSKGKREKMRERLFSKKKKNGKQPIENKFFFISVFH